MEKNITLDLGIYALEELVLSYYQTYFHDYTVKTTIGEDYVSKEPVFLVKTRKILNFYKNSGFEVTLEDVLNIINLQLNNSKYNIDGYTYIKDTFPRGSVRFNVNILENTLVKTK